MIAQLRPKDDTDPITIDRDVTIVGRAPKLCDLVLDHPSVSKTHCVIARTDGLLFFRDLSSTNGTRVNGQRAVRGALLPNDVLQFGRKKFTVFLGPAQPVSFNDRTEAIPVLSGDEVTEITPDDDVVELDDDVVPLEAAASGDDIDFPLLED